MTRIYKKRAARKPKARPAEVVDFAAELVRDIALVGLPAPVREYRFHKVRKWRADLAWPKEKILIEIEGGVHSRGRHVQPVGFMKDIEKYNEATLLGYSLYRVTPSQVRGGEALALIERIFGR